MRRMLACSPMRHACSGERDLGSSPARGLPGSSRSIDKQVGPKLTVCTALRFRCPSLGTLAPSPSASGSSVGGSASGQQAPDGVGPGGSAGGGVESLQMSGAGAPYRGHVSRAEDREGRRRRGRDWAAASEQFSRITANIAGAQQRQDRCGIDYIDAGQWYTGCSWRRSSLSVSPREAAINGWSMRILGRKYCVLRSCNEGGKPRHPRLGIPWSKSMPPRSDFLSLTEVCFPLPELSSVRAAR